MYNYQKGKLILFILFIVCNLKAQDHFASNYIRELNVKFNADELRTLEKGAQTLNQAVLVQNMAKEMYDQLPDLDKKEAISLEYTKALKKILEASELFKTGHAMVYGLFKEKCINFWESMKKVQHYAEGVEKGKYYEGQAKKNLAMATQRREQANIGNRFEFILTKMKEAYELEETAIRDQGRALQVFRDYPVEYNYGWEGDITLEELNELYKNPAINEPPEDIFATVDSNIVVEPALKEEIIFKVQIAAHTVPLTEEYLRTIYKGTMKIDMIYEDEWYKYSIGRYMSFSEANSTLLECKVRKSFIVAYQGGKKLTIAEAVEE